MAQHSERDFLRVIPKILAENGGMCGTSDIISLVPNYVKLTAEDLVCGQRTGRSADEPKYAQIVRNIASHHRPREDATGVVDLGGCLLTRVPRLDEHGNVCVGSKGNSLCDVVYSLVDTDLLENLSPPRAASGRRSRQPRRRRAIDKVEYARRRAYNARIGDLGELFALSWLRERVEADMGADAAAGIVHVGATHDGLGYDIASVGPGGEPFYVEVKTTTAKIADMPFYMSENERSFFEEHAMADDAAVMRVYAFDVDGRTGSVTYPIMASELMRDYDFVASSWKVSRRPVSIP